MVILTAPLGLVGAVPALLLFHQPFGFNAILGLIGLAGILMRNTLILIGQIHTNQQEGLDDYHAVVEATVQRARPVILTALAAVLAFIPLTTSVFWGSMAYTLIGGTAGGTVLILVFLPALYAIWFRVKPATVTTSDGADQPIKDALPEPRASAPKATAGAFWANWSSVWVQRQDFRFAARVLNPLMKPWPDLSPVSPRSSICFTNGGIANIPRACGSS